jgi:phenylacetate-CoA ligase
MSTIYSEILKTAVIPIGDLVKGTHLSKAYKMIKGMKTYSREEIAEWQDLKLRNLVAHAYNHTSYYKDLFNSNGITPGDIKTISDLVYLPVLDKIVIRENFNRLIPDNISKYPFKISSTGGSTGNPLKYYLDLSSWSMSRANSIINWEKAGYDYGEKYVALGSTSLFNSKKQSISHMIYYRLKNKIGLNGVNMSDEKCSNFVSIIKKQRIKYIYGYASSIYLLADFVLRKKIEINIDICFSTSEMLTERFRDIINSAFRCRILDCYGASDSGISAYEHIRGIYEVGYNSILRVEENGAGEGTAIVTDLFNYSMPFINYRIGDDVQISSEARSDEYNGQIIRKIIGRSSDIIYLENGSVLTGPGFTILFKDLPVENYAIRKTGRNSIECNIVKLPGFDVIHEEIVKSTLRKNIGNEGLFTINFLNEIPLSKSGKRKYFAE